MIICLPLQQSLFLRQTKIKLMLKVVKQLSLPALTFKKKALLLYTV